MSGTPKVVGTGLSGTAWLANTVSAARFQAGISGCGGGGGEDERLAGGPVRGLSGWGTASPGGLQGLGGAGGGGNERSSVSPCANWHLRP